MLFLRVEWDGDFVLHYYACQEMMPYFFAASHWNYARDGLVYLRSIERLPNTDLTPFSEGQHVVRRLMEWYMDRYGDRVHVYEYLLDKGVFVSELSRFGVGGGFFVLVIVRNCHAKVVVSEEKKLTLAYNVRSKK